jgi:hypothetical protein
LIRVGCHGVVEKDAVTALPPYLLEREGDEVPESSVRQRVLVREKSIVGVETDLGVTFHGLGQDVSREPARYGCGDSLLEE